MSRRPTSANPSARSVIRSMSGALQVGDRQQVPHLPRLHGGGDRHLVDLVQLLDPHVHPLLARGRQVLADIVGANRELAVATVDEHRELHPLGTPVVEQGVDRRPHGAAGEQDVVHEHHGAPVEVEVEVRGMDHRPGAGLAVVDVVAVERDVEVAERHLEPGQLADQRMQPLAQDGAAGVDADQRETIGTRVLLDDLVGDPHQGAAQIVTVEDDLVLAAHTRPFLASLDRVKGTDAASSRSSRPG